MALSFGLDFGTSNSSIAVYDGSSVTLVPLDPHADEPAVLRSLLYLTRSGERYAGQEAMDRYLQENMGRPVRLERRYVGDVTMTFGGVGTITTQAHAVVDANEPGRLFQSIKTLLPDRMFSKTNLFGIDLTAEDLIVLLAGEIVRRAEAHIGESIGCITVGRPVHYSTTPEGDALARQRMSNAFARLGIPRVHFMDEPVAASISYTHSDHTARRDGTAVIFDFGGGTLDITIVRGAGPQAEVLATGGVPVGGDLLDRRIVDARMLQHFGDGATYGPNRLPVPQHIIRRLLDWQTAFLLNRPEPLSIIEEVVKSGSRPHELNNLRTLVTRNYGAALFRAVEQGKQRLSSAEQTEIELCEPQLAVREVLGREEFEGIIRDQHRAVEQCVAETLELAGVAAADVTAVVTTGGSSRIPLFRHALRERFPAAGLVEQDAFTSVAAGLALHGYEARP